MNSIAYPKQDNLPARLMQLARRPSVGNVLAATTGTAAAQVVTMAFAPVVARQYGPAAFGAVGAFMAVLGVLAPVASLTYPIAMVLPRSDADAKNWIRRSPARPAELSSKRCVDSPFPVGCTFIVAFPFTRAGKL